MSYSFCTKFNSSTVRLHLNEFQGEHCAQIKELLPHAEKYTNILETNIISRIAEYVNTTIYGFDTKVGNVNVGNILPVPGSDAGLEMLVSGRVKKYAKVIVETPSYSQFLYYIPHDVEVINLYTEVWFDSFNLLDALSFYMAGQTERCLLYLCSPNNPSGKMHKYSDVLAIVERYPIDVIIDEAYIEYSHAGLMIAGLAPGTHRGAAIQAAQEECTVPIHPSIYISRTFSKAFGLAALRIGYIISHHTNIAAYTKILNIKNFSPFTERAVNAVLDNREYYLDIARRTIEERERVVRSLSRHKIICGYGNFFMIYLPGALEQLKANNIIVRDRSTLPGLNGFVRITASPNAVVNNLIIKTILELPVPICRVPLRKDTVTEIKHATKYVLGLLQGYMLYPIGRTLDGIVRCGGILSGESGVELCVYGELDTIINIMYKRAGLINTLHIYRPASSNVYMIINKYVKINTGPPLFAPITGYFYGVPINIPYMEVGDYTDFPI